MADTEPLDTTQQDADQLPERIRVHALAKRLGVTSKRILAKLAELGAEARSVQSNVDRAVAETVRDAIAAADAETGESPASTPAAAQPAAPTVAEQPADPTAPAPMFSATEPAGTDPHTDLFTHRVTETPVAEPVTFDAPAFVAPLFLPPDATAAEETRKRRRAERTAKRVEEPVDEVEPETAAEDEAEPGDASDNDTGDNDADGQPRRRRRGRRGRGRGRGEQAADGDDTDTEGADTDTDDESAAAEASTDEAEQADDAETDTEDEDGLPEGASRRRRRRRRRKVGGESGEDAGSDDDPPNTVVHEREPRNKSRGRSGSDEVQGISGSTRLEAKRQRRRDGREAGRRRPPILTESEFLARREAVDRVMVVREKAFEASEHAGHQTTTQVAVLEDNILVEHFVTSSGQASMVGNVYLGKVQNVLPSMEAAFIDIGRGRNGVLYAGEVNWEAAGLGGRERKIEQALKPGDQVLVQVSKDPVGHKGARLTTQISLAGRFLVYVPGGTSTGISRKLPDTERKRLKEILRDIVPADAGVIIRTASEGVSEAELARDVERLQATWRTIEEASKSSGKDAPKALYEEPDMLVKVIRDLFNEDFAKLVIEGERAWSTVETYVRTVAPDLLPRVNRHENNGVDVFDAFRIDEQLAKALDRKVWLPSGGTLVIDRTEAMTVVDVNTGKFTGSGSSNLEETVTKNNLEAAEEIVRQMRLRDIGGMIVVDFIDMVLESNRDLVLRRLTEALGRDRTRHQVSEVTSLGLVQMTRKKLGTGLVEAFSTTCEHCHGRGILVHSYPVDAASGADEQAGRAKEGGSRRRRGKDKDRDKQTAAPATNGTAPAAEHAGEEDIAVKRAHPVALAMAAHHGEDAEHVEEQAVAAAPEEAVVEETVAAEPARRTRSRSRRSSRAAASSEQAAEAPALTGVIPAEPAAEAAEPEAEEPPADEPVTAAVEPEQPVAEQPAAAAVEPEPEPEQPVAEEPAPRTPRRRRVARSTAAPAADSAGAVFVLSTNEQPPAAAVVDFAAEPVVVPERKPRRRAVARPAGAPADSQ
ncbi:putative ribonuclease [Nocardia asteroides NBRC 15531]|uniref:Ribonuclease E n=1 Tax=Nocardia asteroides NBRC 15531 TaxID=1110697 RepID=U5EAR7_NOCAS|nr:translation initiation factor IF-2 N-terminal domain-containing protein [Nocardia asteroides]UGT47103.1 translation initiation factor IF-2 N-terminal domain-containing protein [Nocardia asteroides]GAD87177.1 putative ribonuclease [Nocardia asteroides NBRC 15531]SFM79454.1 ribonuclease E [Nocardia asteroides]VEG34019.1 Ribonuclease G [Nocardia asteroides]